jgi:hypothetical protein
MPLRVRLNELVAAAAAGLAAIRRGTRRQLLDASGKPIGTVRHVLCDACQRILLMEVTSSGRLGLHRRRLLVPGELVSGVTENAIQVALSRERLRDAPVLPARKPGPCLDEVYSYFGCSRPIRVRVLPGSGYTR